MMSCDAIEATQATQVRTKIHKDTVDLYQQDLENGAPFPAIVVFAEKGSARYILSDGFHRLIAHVNAGIEEIDCEVHEGGMHEALVWALGANDTHGLRRSNADKIHAVQMCLKDPALSQLSHQEIADVCRVHKNTVQRTSVRDTTGRGDKDPAKPTKPDGNDVRPTKPEPTQQEIERDEVRAAMRAIKVLPYAGGDAVKLGFDKDDVADLEYVSTWCAHAVLAHRDIPKDGEKDD
jgi:uncharacterized ParB-like nuclease family protein